MRPLLVAVLSLALAGCGSSRGVMLTGDGRLVASTAENFRSEVERNVVEAVRAVVPPEAAVEAHIEDLPRFGESRRDPADGWYFQAIHARVVVGAATPIDAATVVTAATDALRGRTQFRDSTHVVAQIAAQPAAPVAAAAPGVPAATAPPADAASPPPTGAGPRRYVAHAGDTLADLSTAFYGTPEHWRTIREANPQVDFAALRGGEELAIPPAPR